jgi:hypothetical protein
MGQSMLAVRGVGRGGAVWVCRAAAAGISNVMATAAVSIALRLRVRFLVIGNSPFIVKRCVSAYLNHLLLFLSVVINRFDSFIFDWESDVCFILLLALNLILLFVLMV